MTTPDRHPRRRRRHPARWLRDLLRTEILRGSYPDGVLPGEADLMLAHRAPRAVVREALDLLRREGIIERLQGTGTLVLAQRYTARLVEVHGVTDVDQVQFSAHVLAQRELPMPGVVAHHLDERPGTPTLMIEYVGMAAGTVVGLYTNYLRYPEADAVAATPFRSHWYTLMGDAGLQVDETDLLIEVILADEPVAEVLGVPIGHPMLAMQQVIRDETGRPYDFALLRHRGDRLSLLSQARRPTLRPRQP
ncbi:MAG TPA: GntR family transcriptional regulator [Jatrophihabitantaceae bacterium]|jgi:GntR family transcriptional regulator